MPAAPIGHGFTLVAVGLRLICNSDMDVVSATLVQMPATPAVDVSTATYGFIKSR